MRHSGLPRSRRLESIWIYGQNQARCSTYIGVRLVTSRLFRSSGEIGRTSYFAAARNSSLANPDNALFICSPVGFVRLVNGSLATTDEVRRDIFSALGSNCTN